MVFALRTQSGGRRDQDAAVEDVQPLERAAKDTRRPAQ